MSYLVANPEERVSRDEAHMRIMVCRRDTV